MSEVLRFKAGRVEFDENSRICTPIPGRGEISVKKSDEEASFYEFSWKSRDKTASNKYTEPEVLLLMPGEANWNHVKDCKTGRVFCLNFTGGSSNYYWMQEDNGNEDDLGELSSKDKEISEKLEKLLAEPQDEDEDENMAENEKKDEESS